MIVDAALVQRVERSAARLTAMEVDALAASAPQSGAHWRPLDGGVAAVMGPGRYVNRAVGAVLGDQPAEALLDDLESCYSAAGLPASLEVCPWARTDLVDALRRRGFVVEWFRNVYAHGLRTLPPRARMDIEEVDDQSVAVWAGILGSQFEPGTPARAGRKDRPDRRVRWDPKDRWRRRRS